MAINTGDSRYGLSPTNANILDMTAAIMAKTQGAPVNFQDVQGFQNAAKPPMVSDPAPQFQQRLSDFSPEEQNIIQQISNQLGMQTPAGVINGQIVDQQGNPIQGAPTVEKFGSLMDQVQSGGVNVNQISPSGNIIYPSNPSTPSGLSGAEQAIQQSTGTALGVLKEGYNQARDDLSSGTQSALNQLGQSNAQVADTAIFTDDRVQQRLQDGRSDAINTALEAQRMGAEPLQPFLEQGQQASGVQAALSGAMGRDAQQGAYNDFMSSPGQAYLREQAEKSLLRNSAALGGLGGGNVRQALQEQAVGLAAQDYGNQFNRLGQVADRGAQAGQGISGLTGQLGGTLMGQLGGMVRQGAGITGNLGSNVINQMGSANQLGAQMSNNQGQNLANLTSGMASGGANLISGAGGQVAQNRFTTGTNLANALQGGSSQIADLTNQQGNNLSNILGQGSGNLANLLAGTGQQVGGLNQALASLLANIATQQGSQVAGLPGIPGVQNSNGNTVTDAGKLLSGLGAGISGLA